MASTIEALRIAHRLFSSKDCRPSLGVGYG
jgi:hypothetical protein